MLTELQAYYLETMGIERWVLRQKPSTTSKSQLDQLTQMVAKCTRCPLHQSRTNTVFSRGNPQAQFMIIGEAPGYHEDKQGRPFVGKAGMLLDRMLHSIGLDENKAYIANVLKCRPPENRDPKAEEITQCRSYLDQQIELIQPKLILGLGRFAAQFIINKTLPLAQARQKIYTYQGIPCMISYHPAYLLRNPKDKKKAYFDLLRVKGYLEKV